MPEAGTSADSPAAQAATGAAPAQRPAETALPSAAEPASSPEQDEAHVEAHADAAEPVGSQSILEGKLILIVEDVDENAEIAADLLELEGAESERAESGQVALEMFEASPEYRYDAVLMDLRMPVMDGLQATRCIRALKRPDAKTVPILALTANAFDSDVEQSLQAGMNVHLAKPVDADQLYETLERLIRQMQAERTGDAE
jgi:CheY-like chemotaxis protein